MTVTLPDGSLFTCTWIVHIQGPGLRVEMRYPESSTQDLDLYLKQPGKTTPWFTGEAQFSTSLDQCCWANCEANLRGGSVMPAPVQPVTRADWELPDQPARALRGRAAGPLLARSRVLREPAPRHRQQPSGRHGTARKHQRRRASRGRDVPDHGRELHRHAVSPAGERLLRRPPHGDHRRGPDQVPNFSGTSGSVSIGALWRVADGTTHVTGTQTSCTVSVLHAPASPTALDVTYDDPRF